MVVVVAPSRGILSNQGPVAPSRGTKNNQSLVESLTAYSSPHLPLLNPFYPHPPEPGGWRPAIQLDSELNRILISALPLLYSLPQESCIILHALNLLFIR